MLRHLLVIFTLILTFQSVSWGADKIPDFKQKDFASIILQQFLWDKGLPKEPADRDYLSILGGKRTFRYEAENAYNPETDRVTVRDFPIFGAFTGKGWLLGVSDTTSSTFTILLPIAGEYDFKAVVKGKGFVWNIDGKEYLTDSKSEKFKELYIGKLSLKAGIITINLTIPPEGAIDSFSLTAPDYAPIRPFIGWRFKEALNAANMAEVAVALTNSYSKLPDADPATYPKPIVVADKIPLPPNTGFTNAEYLGSFSSPRWVRADFRGATLQIPINISEAGYYTLTANVMGEEISGSVNDTPFKLIGKQYLNKLNLGLYRLETGDNMLTIVLPPTGGIDTVEFTRKSSTAADFMRLAGVAGSADRLIDKKEATQFLKSIQGTFTVRK